MCMAGDEVLAFVSRRAAGRAADVLDEMFPERIHLARRGLPFVARLLAETIVETIGGIGAGARRRDIVPLRRLGPGGTASNKPQSENDSYRQCSIHKIDSLFRHDRAARGGDDLH